VGKGFRAVDGGENMGINLLPIFFHRDSAGKVKMQNDKVKFKTWGNVVMVLPFAF